MSAGTIFSTFPGNNSPIRIQTSKKSSSSSSSVRISCHAAASVTERAAREGRRMGLYGVLGVKETASTAEIKAAYRALAKQYHPDVVIDNGGGRSPDQLFMEIHKAYSTLSDPKERQKYDHAHMASEMFVGFGLNNNNNNNKAAAVQGVDGMWFRSTRRWETDQCW